MPDPVPPPPAQAENSAECEYPIRRAETGLAPVTTLHETTPANEAARAEIANWPDRTLTEPLATAVLNKSLYDLLTGPALEHRYAGGILNATHTIIRLEAGEPTSITRDEALAAVKELQKRAQERINNTG